MRYYVPEYFSEFKCIADKCKHTCCRGWEIDIDNESLPRFMAIPYISQHIADGHIILDKDERCPFLRTDGLCDIIINQGEDFLCQICTDHPRFRNFWANRTEIGLGMVCEEAARIILTWDKPFELIETRYDGFTDFVSDEERAILSFRDRMMFRPDLSGAKARLWEYLVFRHIADAIYDNRLEARIRFIHYSFDEIVSLWNSGDGSLDSMIDIVRVWSYDNEYDDEALEKNIAYFEH